MVQTFRDEKGSGKQEGSSFLEAVGRALVLQLLQNTTLLFAQTFVSPDITWTPPNELGGLLGRLFHLQKLPNTSLDSTQVCSQKYTKPMHGQTINAWELRNKKKRTNVGRRGALALRGLPRVEGLGEATRWSGLGLGGCHAPAGAGVAGVRPPALVRRSIEGIRVRVMLLVESASWIAAHATTNF